MVDGDSSQILSIPLAKGIGELLALSLLLCRSKTRGKMGDKKCRKRADCSIFVLPSYCLKSCRPTWRLLPEIAALS